MQEVEVYWCAVVTVINNKQCKRALTIYHAMINANQGTNSWQFDWEKKNREYYQAVQSLEPNNEQWWIAGNLAIDTQVGFTVDTLSLHNTINDINVKVIRNNEHISGVAFRKCQNACEQSFQDCLAYFSELLHQKAGLLI